MSFDVRAVALEDGIRLELLTEAAQTWFDNNFDPDDATIREIDGMLSLITLEPEFAAEVVRDMEAAGLRFEEWFPELGGAE